MGYDYRSAMGRADSSRTDVWGVLLLGLLFGALIGVCVWAALA